MRAIEFVWREQKIEFEDLGDGGFRANIRPTIIQRAGPVQVRRRRAAAEPQIGVPN
jgi:hypothetical protein